MNSLEYAGDCVGMMNAGEVFGNIVSLSPQETIQELLQAIDGSYELVSMLADVDVSMVQDWESGLSTSSDVHQNRLHNGLYLARIVADDEVPQQSRNWLIAPNPYINEASPYEKIATLTFPEETALMEARLQAAAIGYESLVRARKLDGSL